MMGINHPQCTQLLILPVQWIPLHTLPWEDTLEIHRLVDSRGFFVHLQGGNGEEKGTKRAGLNVM